MTTYELLNSIPADKRKAMARAGIMPTEWVRYIHIYECVRECIRKGMPKMDAYCTASERFTTCEGNIRKIVARMERAV